MQAEAPQPYLNQDTSISSDVLSIQDQYVIIVEGDHGENQQEQQANQLTAPEMPSRPELVRQFISQIACLHDDIEIHQQKMLITSRGQLALHVVQTEEGYTVDETANKTQHYLLIHEFEGTISPGRDYELVFRRIDEEEEEKDIGFVDPYNNRRMKELRIALIDTPEEERRHQLSILTTYDDKDIEAYKRTIEERQRVTFYVPNRDKSTILVPEEVKIGVNTGIFQHDYYAIEPTLLSGDVDAHAKALIDLVVSLIPQTNPQLPASDTTGEK